MSIAVIAFIFALGAIGCVLTDSILRMISVLDRDPGLQFARQDTRELPQRVVVARPAPRSRVSPPAQPWRAAA